MSNSMSTLSLNKSFLTSLTKFIKFNKIINVINPPYNINKTISKIKTDRGNQLINTSKFKKCLKTKKLETNRLDIILFYLNFTRSITESHELIRQKLVYVNNKLITNTLHLLEDYSIITCNNNNNNSYIAHKINNIFNMPNNLIRINEKTGIYIKNNNNLIIPKEINLALIRRSSNIN